MAILKNWTNQINKKNIWYQISQFDSKQNKINFFKI